MAGHGCGDDLFISVAGGVRGGGGGGGLKDVFKAWNGNVFKGKLFF